MDKKHIIFDPPLIEGIIVKRKAQHQNVFLTALSCQGTFITF
jgi:hypothetical protein